jgi:predicted outer membrane protein
MHEVCHSLKFSLDESLGIRIAFALSELNGEGRKMNYLVFMKHSFSGMVFFLPFSPAMADLPAMTTGETLSQLHHMNQMEIQMGTLARERGGSVDVRRYGDRLVRDHSFADKEVIQISKQSEIPIFKVVPNTSEERKNAREEVTILNRLKTAWGRDFDIEFLQYMEKGHTKVVDMLEAARITLGVQTVRDLVVKLIPILRQHHDLAVHLEQRNNA